MRAIPTHTPTALSSQAPILELDQTEHPIRHAILTQPLVHARGGLAIPAGPALGIEIDRDALEAFRAA